MGLLFAVYGLTCAGIAAWRVRARLDLLRSHEVFDGLQALGRQGRRFVPLSARLQDAVAGVGLAAASIRDSWSELPLGAVAAAIGTANRALRLIVNTLR